MSLRQERMGYWKGHIENSRSDRNICICRSRRRACKQDRSASRRQSIQGSRKDREEWDSGCQETYKKSVSWRKGRLCTLLAGQASNAVAETGELMAKDSNRIFVLRANKADLGRAELSELLFRGNKAKGKDMVMFNLPEGYVAEQGAKLKKGVHQWKISPKVPISGRGNMRMPLKKTQTLIIQGD